jgi:hypothetical protein
MAATGKSEQMGFHATGAIGGSDGKPEFSETTEKMEYKKIRNLIAEGNLSESIETLIQEVEGSKISEKNEVILQSSRLNNILKEKRIGVVTAEESTIVINQVTNGILTLVDNLERKYPEIALSETKRSDTSANLNNTISLILGKSVSLQDKNIEQIQHLAKLYEIHKTNLQASEEAAAKWGELAPSIITHKITENRQKIEELKSQIAALI